MVARLRSDGTGEQNGNALNILSTTANPPDGDVTKRAMKTREDKAAVGGLRNPHESLNHIPASKVVGRKVQVMIDEEINGVELDWVQVFGTIGHQEAQIPEGLRQIALTVRERMAEEFGVKCNAGSGLQGELLEAVLMRMGDPDLTAARWLKDKAVPLGIEREIKPGGVFPTATTEQADASMDFWAPLVNYASFQEHREGAEQLLQKEREKGCMDWRASESELKRVYGEVSYSRIGVVAKEVGEATKLRLVRLAPIGRESAHSHV